MPLARLVQYQHCLLRRNGVRTEWSASYHKADTKFALQRLRAEFELADKHAGC